MFYNNLKMAYTGRNMYLEILYGYNYFSHNNAIQ